MIFWYKLLDKDKLLVYNKSRKSAIKRQDGRPPYERGLDNMAYVTYGDMFLFVSTICSVISLTLSFVVLFGSNKKK